MKTSSEMKLRAWFNFPNTIQVPSVMQPDQSLAEFLHDVENASDGWEYILTDFVGIYDTNNKEVYVDDIVRVQIRGGKIAVGLVKFFPEYGIYGILPNHGARRSYQVPSAQSPLGSTGSSTPYKPYTWKSYKSITVIGNIYQNPEMLSLTV